MSNANLRRNPIPTELLINFNFDFVDESEVSDFSDEEEAELAAIAAEKERRRSAPVSIVDDPLKGDSPSPLSDDDFEEEEEEEDELPPLEDNDYLFDDYFAA